MDDITFCRNMLNLVWLFNNVLWREVVVSLPKQQQKIFESFGATKQAKGQTNKQREKLKNNYLSPSLFLDWDSDEAKASEAGASKLSDWQTNKVETL